GLDPGDVALHGAHACGVLQLAAGTLETEVERLLLQRDQVGLQLVLGFDPQLFRLHDQGSYSSPSRVTTRDLIDSLAAARANASIASGFCTPSISNMIRPGWMRATQYSGEPLPEPMRTSAGLRLTGTSGNTRIQTLPTRFMWRVIARRAASIWRAVIRPGSTAFNP